MLTLKLAFRTLMRRKGRMALIGSLVAFGTLLIAFGGTFANSTAIASRNSIIDNYTGDFIIYSSDSKELPSPFAFNTPLPRIGNADAVEAALGKIPDVRDWTKFAQNYGIIEVERNGKKIDMPYIFYAVDPESYRKVFPNLEIKSGSYIGEGNAGSGILVSEFQNAQYRKNYGTEVVAGEKVKLLGVTEGGANTVVSTVAGIFAPIHYTNVFNYINFMDSATYAQLYGFAGVEALPEGFDSKLAAATDSEENLFALAGDDSFGKIDVATLKPRELSGSTMIAVRLADHSKIDAVMAAIDGDASLGVKTARWDKASGFYAQISLALQAFIFVATALIFLVVTMIFMNTLIINVVERTAEIGTMRAMGADKSFVRGVFLAETLILNGAAALAGMILAAALIAANANGLPLPDIVSQYLIGGGPLPLTVGAEPFAIALVTVVGVSILATLYPVRVATTITPLKAMSER